MNFAQRLTYLALLALSFMLCTGTAVAQDAPETAPDAPAVETPVDPAPAEEAAPEPALDAPDIDAVDPSFLFGSSAGLAVFGIIFTGFIRKYFATSPVLKDVPLPIWPFVGSAVGLGLGILLGLFDGDWQTLLTQIILGGFIAAGGYSGAKNLTTTAATKKA